MNVYAIVILVSLTFGACEQPNEIAPDLSTVEEDAAFELQWATRMDYEKEIVGTDHTQQYQGWMLIGGDLGFPPTIMAFNKGTGEKEWEYAYQGAVQDEIDFLRVRTNIRWVLGLGGR